MGLFFGIATWASLAFGSESKALQILSFQRCIIIAEKALSAAIASSNASRACYWAGRYSAHFDECFRIAGRIAFAGEDGILIKKLLPMNGLNQKGTPIESICRLGTEMKELKDLSQEIQKGLQEIRKTIQPEIKKAISDLVDG